MAFNQSPVGEEVTDNPTDIWHYRLEQAEVAIATLAEAAADQTEFNAAVRTWGKVALLVFSVTQSLLVVAVGMVAKELIK